MPAFCIGAACAAFAAWAYRLLPDKWVCDYGETPAAHHGKAARRLPMWAMVLLAVLGGACTYCTTAHLFPQGWCLPVTALLYAALLLAAVCDIQYQILPDELLAAAAVLGLMLLCSSGMQQLHGAWWRALAAGAAGFGGLWLILFVAAKLYKTEAVGFGDVKLCGVAGLLCGFAGLSVCLLAAVLSAALVFGILLLCGKVQRRSTLAFGPFIVFGICIALGLWPEWHAALAWYLSLF